MIRRSIPAVLLTTTLVSCLAWAQAYSRGGDGTITDPGLHARSPDLSLMAYLPWVDGVGFGLDLRFEIPVLPDGFIPNVNDEFAIEPALKLAYRSYGYGYNYPFGNGDSVHFFDVVPAVYGIWSFWFSPKFRAYGGLGLGYDVAIASGTYGGPNAGRFYWDPVVGLFYSFARNVAVRGEAGAQGLKGGLSFSF